MPARSLQQRVLLGLFVLLAFAPSALGAEPAEFTGKVLETMDTDTYTYVRVSNGDQEAWAAAPRFPVAVGEQVAFSTGMPMKDFKSETLKRTFAVVYFTNEIRKAGAAGQAPMAAPAAKAPAAAKAPGVPAPSASPMTRIDPPAGGTAIAALVARPAEFSGKRVTVRGKIVKFNANILGKNWLHLRDGSGVPGAAAGTDDITVTTSATAKLGDVVTVTGVVATNRDFGSGYSYAVMIEEATLAQP